jgi:hypothetical protein
MLSAVSPVLRSSTAEGGRIVNLQAFVFEMPGVLELSGRWAMGQTGGPISFNVWQTTRLRYGRQGRLRYDGVEHRGLPQQPTHAGGRMQSAEGAHPREASRQHVLEQTPHPVHSVQDHRGG